MKWVRLQEASYYLDTSVSTITVTACQYKKRNGNYPCWYKSEDRKAYVDISYLQTIREREEKAHSEATDLYFFIVEDMGIIQSKLAIIIAEQSKHYKKVNSWMSFMQTALFGSPFARFYDRVTRLQEFYRIAKQLKEEYLCKKEI